MITSQSFGILYRAREQGIQTGVVVDLRRISLLRTFLHITGVDPIRYNLLFERFLNCNYTMPDIDLDFPEMREDILAYIVSKYGNQRRSANCNVWYAWAKQVIQMYVKLPRNIITVQKFSNNVAQGKVTLEQTYKEKIRLENMWK